MKRFIVLIALIIYVFSFQSTALAVGANKAQSVDEAIKNGVKSDSKTQVEEPTVNSPSLFGSIVKFVFYFAIIIVLLYLLLRFMAKRNKGITSSGPILSLGGQSLGNNKSIQVMLIGQTIYIIGVGDSISVLRTITHGEEYQELMEAFDNQSETLTQRWLTVDTKKIWDSVLGKNLSKMQKENEEE